MTASVEDLDASWRPARVIRVDRGQLRVHDGAAEFAVPTNTVSSDELRPPTAGDWLLTDGARSVLLPARNLLARQRVDRSSLEQPLAANIDVVLITEPCRPNPNRRRIDRILVLAEASGARPVVLLTKHDLVADTAAHDEFVAALERFGVEVHSVRADAPEHLALVRGLIPHGATAVMIGPSGAGKSTLLNGILGGETMRTGDVRGDFRGMHTTTHRELVAIPGGGILIDSPGIRSVGLPAGAESVDHVFADVHALAEQCRFSNCEHRYEPDCGVRAAIDAGELDEHRLMQYLDYRDEIEAARQRASQGSRREQRNDSASRARAKRVASEAKQRRRGE